MKKFMGAWLFSVSAVLASEQVWTGSLDPVVDPWVWNGVAPLWDGGAVWSNGNSARFSSTGGVITVDADISASGLRFSSGNYFLTSNATPRTVMLSTGAVVTVDSGATGLISVAVANTGFSKKGQGVLQLNASNPGLTGDITIEEGTLRFAAQNVASLGLEGKTVTVLAGATLDVNNAVTVSFNKQLVLVGSGMNRIGAVVNNKTDSASYANKSLGTVTLAGDTTLGGWGRMDLLSTYPLYNPNNYVLTKTGTCEVAVSRSIGNTPLVVGEGVWTVMGIGAGGTASVIVGPNGRLNSWATQTNRSTLIFDHGKISNNEDATNRMIAFVQVAPVILRSGMMRVIDGTSRTNLGVEIASSIEGAGGIGKWANHYLWITATNSTFTGASYIDYSSAIWMGRPGGSPVGTFGSGIITNHGVFYIGNTNNAICRFSATGSGFINKRYVGRAIFDGGVISQEIKVQQGELVLTNSAQYVYPNAFYLGSHITNTEKYPEYDYTQALTNILTVYNGAKMQVNCIESGNTTNSTWLAVGIINHVGGTIVTTGKTEENNGVRLGHWPGGRSVYNMIGGALIISNNYYLACEVDGQGWFNMSGGEVRAAQIKLKTRTSAAGYGRLTMTGGTIYPGAWGASAGNTNAFINGFSSDYSSNYLMELSGGCISAATTNIEGAVDATLFGSRSGGVTFDSVDRAIVWSGVLSGTGSLHKAGSGLLALTQSNTVSGCYFVDQGMLSLSNHNPFATVAVASNAVLDLCGKTCRLGGLYGDGVVSNGVVAGTVTVAIREDGTAPKLHVAGDVDATRFEINLIGAMPDRTKQYDFLTYSGTLTGYPYLVASARNAGWVIGVNTATKTLRLTAWGSLMILK